MNQATEQIAQQFAAAAINKKQWGDVAYNALVEGLAGNGTTDDTVKLQALIDKAVAAGRKAIFFPHGTYKVTALTNDDQVVLFGDNASFVGGYTGTIRQIGVGFDNPVTEEIDMSSLKIINLATPTNANDAANKTYIDTNFMRNGTLVLNVKEYGAKGDGTTDDTSAIQAVFNAVPVGTNRATAIFFPAGQYRVTGTINITGRTVSILGAYGHSSQILVDVDGVTIFNIDGTGAAFPLFCAITGMSFMENGQRNTVTLIKSVNMENLLIRDLVTGCGGTHIDYSGNFLMIDQARIEAYGGTAIRLRRGGGCWTNIYARCADFTAQGRPANKPAVWIQGQTTSLQVSNCSFAGVGSPLSTTVSSVASTAADFTLSVSSTTGFSVGDRVYVSGTTIAGYTGVFVVNSIISATQMRCISTLNPGAATGGTVRKLKACLYMDNSLGPINETSWTNVLFEGINGSTGTNNDDGSVSVYLDAQIASHTIASHKFNNCYYDIGQTGVLMLGNNLGGGALNINDIGFIGGTVKALRRGFEMRQVRGIRIQGFSFEAPTPRTTNTNDINERAAIEIDTRNGQPSRGISITDSIIGRNPDWRTDTMATWAYIYGIWLRGAAGSIQDMVISGNHIFGLTEAIHGTDGMPDAAGRWKIKGNYSASGSTDETSSSYYPAIASAAAISIPLGVEIFNITGTTGINTINGGWLGREVKFVTVAAVTFTGGNISVSLTTVAGQLVNGFFDGSAWHLK